MKNKKIVLIIIIIILSLGTITLAILGNNSNITFEKFQLPKFNLNSKRITYDINETKTYMDSEIKEIQIKTISENVHVEESNNNEIEIIYSGEIRANNPENLPEFYTNIMDNELIIEIKYKKNSFFSFLSNISSDTKLSIYIPKKFGKNISITTVSGDIDMDENRYDDINLDSISGNINLVNINAVKINVGTISGGMKISGESNTFYFKSISGDIKSDNLYTQEASVITTSGKASISNFEGDLYFKSVSGNINIIYNDFDNSLEVSTTSGDADIILPSNSDFFIDFSSTSGDIQNSFKMAETDIKSDNKLKGTVGDGENSIRIRTVSGNVDLTEK